MKLDPTINFDGSIGTFAKAMLTEASYSHGDGMLATWTLLPAMVVDSKDANEERRRAKVLAWEAYRLVVKALCIAGDSTHASMLGDAVERNKVHPSTYGKCWQPPDGATGHILDYLRLKYNGTPLARMVEAAFWIAVALSKRDLGGSRRHDDDPRQAAEYAGRVFAAWRGYVGDTAYEHASHAILAAVSKVEPVNSEDVVTV